MPRSNVCRSPPGEDGIRPRRCRGGLRSLKPSEYCRLACGAAEVGHACAHMDLTRGAANELLVKILAKYEDRIADAHLASHSEWLS